MNSTTTSGQFATRSFQLLLSLAVLANFGLVNEARAASKETHFYIGTYTGAKSKGIYHAKLDLTTGALSAPELAAEVASPSFLAVHPNGRFVYSANEVSNFGGKPSGAISAYQVDGSSGRLSLLNQQSSVGAGPCHLVVDKSGRTVLAANYGGGSVCALPIGTDGKLGEAASFIQHKGSSVNPSRQKEPHAHSINVSPDNRFAFAADLGLDKIMSYRLDGATAELTANDPPWVSLTPGAGPRHFAFHPGGKYAYVINEIHLTMTTFKYDAKAGVLEAIQTLGTVPGGPKDGYSTAEVVAHPSGKFVYGSNRGHDSIAVFQVEAKTGKLTLVQNQSTLGRTPRNFNVDPSGKFLLACNQNSDSIVVFRIDPKTGQLTDTGHKASVGSPVCVKFLATWPPKIKG